MGTSKSIPTPKGGRWTPLKAGISSALSGNPAVSPESLVAGTVDALGGLAPLLGMPRDDAGGSADDGSARRAARPTGASARRSVARTASGLAGFASAVQAGGLDAGLEAVGLDSISGRPAAEVIARVAERLAETATGQQQALLTSALREAILHAAEAQGDVGYEDLEASLQAFLDDEGVEGLVEEFLGNYIFELVWYAIEEHVDNKAERQVDAEALASAVRNASRSQVRAVIRAEQAQGRFARVDWFGREGIARGEQIAADLESQLLAAR